jgi:heterodisulfide reductase subunit C
VDRPGELSAREKELRAAFLAEVTRIPGGDRLRRCIQCGSCSGSCPVSEVMDVQPRGIVAYFRAGDLEAILRSRTIWLCASCYACTVRCPAGIKVTDLIYALKRMALERRIQARSLPIYALSQEFVRVVGRHGRNHELELLVRYLLRKGPLRLLAMAPLGLRLIRAGRWQWFPKRVKDRKGLRRILARAGQMEDDFVRESAAPAGSVGYGVVADRAAAVASGGGS